MYKCIPGIYCILCKINKKLLIGETGNIQKRLRDHKNRLSNNTHENPYLQKAWNKYGSENFEFHLLEYCNFEDSKIRENYYCILYDTHNPEKGYNIRPTGTDLKGKFSEETKKKISETLSKSEKFKNRDSGLGMRGKCHSIKSKLKISNSNKGKKLSKEHIHLLSTSHKGIKRKKESIEKQIINRKNNGSSWHSEETKNKMSKSRQGLKMSDKSKQKMKMSKYKPILQFDLNNNFIKEWLGASYIRDILGYNQSNITRVCNNKRKTAHDYIWKYKQ